MICTRVDFFQLWLPLSSVSLSLCLSHCVSLCVSLCLSVSLCVSVSLSPVSLPSRVCTLAAHSQCDDGFDAMRMRSSWKSPLPSLRPLMSFTKCNICSHVRSAAVRCAHTRHPPSPRYQQSDRSVVSSSFRSEVQVRYSARARAANKTMAARTSTTCVHT